MFNFSGSRCQINLALNAFEAFGASRGVDA
jgi:hypothetical protein